jgi:hypothetical protein
MDGYWRLLYTDNPPAPNSGKFGPFIGEVFQELNSEQGKIKNILNLKNPPIVVSLTANQTVKNKNTWCNSFFVIIYLQLFSA